MDIAGEEEVDQRHTSGNGLAEFSHRPAGEFEAMVLALPGWYFVHAEAGETLETQTWLRPARPRSLPVARRPSPVARQDPP